VISVKLPQSTQPLTTTKATGKQAASAAATELPVFDATPTRCTIQPGNHVFTTVTFCPAALQVTFFFPLQPFNSRDAVVSVCKSRYRDFLEIYTCVAVCSRSWLKRSRAHLCSVVHIRMGALKMREWNLRHKRGQKCRAGKCEKNKLGAHVCG